MIFIALPFIISFFIGYLLIHCFFKETQQPPFFIHVFLAGGLGLGISAFITFTSFLIFNQLNPFFIKITNIFFLIFLTIIYMRTLIKHKTYPFKNFPIRATIPFLLLGIIAIPLWFQSIFYAFGGWDAWATWNLKAKFLFLGGENWQNLLEPVMWRSSPHYPLLLPLINVWGWCWTKTPLFQIPVLTAFSTTLLTVGLLFAGLKKLTSSHWSLLPCIFLLTSPLLNKLSLSQYADGLLGYYLLASILCLILARMNTCKIFAFLSGIFCGLLSFTKTEGLAAAALIILFALPYLLWKNKEKKITPLLLTFFIGAGIAFLPTLIFKFIYSPGNQTFINGLISTEAPSKLIRLKITLGFYLVEMFGLVWNAGLLLNPKNTMAYIELKWCSVWLVATASILLSFRKLFKKESLLIPFFLISYMTIFTFYYFFNTKFSIEWWLQVTLHRVLAAMLPTVLFWVFWMAWQKKGSEPFLNPTK
ncbi:hypothetical protein MNBD_UNCLBAC01-1637 [hydrothermal vent metagenome]|uniref:Glycosyltransferase RgtA/B/C/D-like domain-containing protein n=1 Tax=hydrothermal vent metagenome TaxID=652676 RepID=A0A3B1D430_9ZZZZ